MAETEPEQAAHLERMVLGKDVNMEHIVNTVIPDDEIHFYPGSIKGPNPEDDPDAWSDWYWKHQPKSAFLDGKIKPEDVGVKVKYIKPNKDKSIDGWGE